MKRNRKLVALGLAMMLAVIPAMTAFAETEGLIGIQEEQEPEEASEEKVPEAEAPEEKNQEEGEQETSVNTPSDAEEPEGEEELAEDALAGEPEPKEAVSYSYPVYNTDGVVTSGIKEWKTGEIGGTSGIDYTVVENSTSSVTWTAGWYVVSDTVVLSKGAVCNGAVKLVLADNCTLTANGNGDEAGIRVSGSGNSLTVYAQSTDSSMGMLKAYGGNGGSAGIGGYSDGSHKYPGENITINGGNITAVGECGGAGIGGYFAAAASNIVINGGIVTASGQQGAGIGGGCYGGNASNITINGGTVTAIGDSFDADHVSAGIGGGGGSYNSCNGDAANIRINGGTVAAVAGGNSVSAIGAGNAGTASSIFVADNVVVKAGSEADPTAVVAHASVTEDIASALEGKRYATAVETVPEAVSYSYPVYNTDGIASSGIKEWKTGEIGGTSGISYKVVEASEDPVTWTAGWYVADGTVELSDGAVCNGEVHLILKDGCELNVTSVSQAGICVSGSVNSLTVYGQSADTGKLCVTGGSDSAGIGGGSNQGGSNITVNGGTVTAYGGNCGAGIGGGWQGSYSAGDSIIINGGTVTAQGGLGGAGIGGGACRGGYNILINGGTVTAEGGQAAALYQPGAGIGNGGKTAGEGAILCGSGEIRISTDLTVKAGTEANPSTVIAKDRSDDTDIASELNGKQYATVEKAEAPDPEPEPESASEPEESRPSFTGTQGDSADGTEENPVTDGKWNCGPDGSWTFRTNGLFRNTWGYIRLENGKTGWFWFDKNGVMQSGWQQVNGKWYYFKEVHDGTFGMMLSDTTTPDGYRVGADGALVK